MTIYLADVGGLWQKDSMEKQMVYVVMEKSLDPNSRGSMPSVHCAFGRRKDAEAYVNHQNDNPFRSYDYTWYETEFNR